MTVIDIGRDFSLVTGGRCRSDGPHSAEAFRDDLLVPALRGGGHVVVRIGGPSYSMAWLEEVFGTLPTLGFSRVDLEHRLIIEADEGYRHTKMAIERYILGLSPVSPESE
ncbi:hypothetical protein N825_30670 [Skermanella stibiiresistens SB22]|uniref:Uncharacterized protein n=1 Tax=Skermanella stibiiresistens SB22 TaxID=1385369 RepID=W9H8N0_9PROT|nr:hypothetical protein [Skermanella stibiiresistens]EWY41047.1 hypothetical protein N825_30670 [Skermanella stibiiresistens SB22]